jgi:hypothetical protein
MLLLRFVYDVTFQLYMLQLFWIIALIASVMQLHCQVMAAQRRLQHGLLRGVDSAIAE